MTDDFRESTVELLERAQGGDAAALRALIGRALPSVRRWAHGRLPKQVRHDANTEDVVQDAVLQTLKGLHRVRFQTVGALQAYLRATVHNRIRDLLRRVSRRGVPVPAEPQDECAADEPSPLERAIHAQRLETFVAALGHLAPGDRQLIIWRFEFGYSVEEIAARLGTSKPAAGMRVTRAVARLAHELRIEPDQQR